MELKAWVHPRTGEVRYYLNGWLEGILDYEETRYKTGNISDASMFGYWISNNKARRVGGTFYVVDGKVYGRLSTTTHEIISDLHARHEDDVPAVSDVIERIKQVALSKYSQEIHSDNDDEPPVDS